MTIWPPAPLPFGGHKPEPKKPERHIDTKAALGFVAGGVTVGLGLTAVLNKVTSRVPRFDMRLAAMGVGLAAGAGAVALANPDTKGKAMGIGGATGGVAGALAGGLVARSLGGNIAAPYGALVGGMWGAVMGFNASAILAGD